MAFPVDRRVLESSSRSGFTRRDFLKALGLVAAALGLPTDSLFAAFTASLAKTPRLPVIWLGCQDCTGDTESLLRAAERSDPIKSSLIDPAIVDLLLSVISVDYHETIMAPSGAAADKSRTDTIAKYAGKYVAIIEGAIPTGNNGAFCVIGGRTALSIAQEVCSKARATIALGTCAAFGGLPAAAPNPTAAKSVGAAIPGLKNLVNIPGCPANVVNLVATIVYVVAYNTLPSLDGQRRPSFAFNTSVHERCPRKDRAEDGPWVKSWGDAAHRSRGCLIRMGCRGPRTHANCPSVKWNAGTCWPVQGGHGCIGCTEPNFWDTTFPCYSRPLRDTDEGDEDDDD